jgi:hypothetical protein
MYELVEYGLTLRNDGSTVRLKRRGDENRELEHRLVRRWHPISPLNDCRGRDWAPAGDPYSARGHSRLSTFRGYRGQTRPGIHGRVMLTPAKRTSPFGRPMATVRVVAAITDRAHRR